jgi:hypothetical protein
LLSTPSTATSAADELDVQRLKLHAEELRRGLALRRRGKQPRDESDDDALVE